MDRLTEWYDDGQRKGILVKESYGENCLKTLYQKFGDYPVGEFLDCEEGYFAMHKLAEFEDLEEQGLLLRLPCKVGDDVWILYVDKFLEKKTVVGIDIRKEYDRIHFDDGYQYTTWEKDYSDFNRWIFLTKAEAESALEKMKGEEHE